MTDLTERITNFYKKDSESINRVLFYLDYEDQLGKGEQHTKRMLMSLDNKQFQSSLKRICKETETTLKDEYEKFLTAIKAKLTPNQSSPSMVEYQQGAPSLLHTAASAVRGAGSAALTKNLYLVAKSQGVWYEVIKDVVKSSPPISYLEQFEYLWAPIVNRFTEAPKVSASNIASKASVYITPGIVSLQLLYYCGQYHRGTISRDRLKKKAIDCVGSTTTGALLAAGLGAVGGVLALGPAALIALSIGGGLVGGVGGQIVMDKKTLEWYDLTSDENLENAFRCLNLSPKASNDEINQQFDILRRRYNPIFGDGDKVKYKELSESIKLIRENRGSQEDLSV